MPLPLSDVFLPGPGEQVSRITSSGPGEINLRRVCQTWHLNISFSFMSVDCGFLGSVWSGGSWLICLQVLVVSFRDGLTFSKDLLDVWLLRTFLGSAIDFLR